MSGWVCVWVWVGGCVDGWVGEWVGVWVGGWVSEWVGGWVIECRMLLSFLVLYVVVLAHIA